jgi:nucleoside-diphosphate-sugar epimerase
MKNWKGVRVLVTGAGGFIGSHLTEELVRRGAIVRALVRYNSRGDHGFLEGVRAPAGGLDVWAGDVCDPYYTAKLVERQEVVFHLAALIAIPLLLRRAEKLHLGQCRGHPQRAGGQPSAQGQEGRAYVDIRGVRDGLVRSD